MPDESSFTQCVQTAFASSIGSMAGRQFHISTTHSAIELQRALIWQQSFSCVDGPSFWVAAGAETWESIGRLILQAAGLDDVGEEDCRSTWQEILSQSSGAIASSLTASLGREVTASDGGLIAMEPPHVAWHAFSIADQTGKTWLLKVAWATALSALEEPPAEEPAAPKSRDASVSKTFDLLLEIALPVAVSFGKTSLKIKEVLKLNTGSIVELDRFVTDPVEVIVNDCVVARGEVVVVDGNYGVRINHLASREERLRSGMAEMSRKGAGI